MERALKYTFISLIAIVVVAVGFVYGLYFAGARHIPMEWKPTTAIYPDHARVALWRSLGGQGDPIAETMSPIGYAWRIARMLSDDPSRDRPAFPPGVALASRTARHARFMGRQSQGGSHLMEAAATVRASRWPVEAQLDTVLDKTNFGSGVRGYRQGASHFFGHPLERLDAAQLHLLVTIEWAPSAYDPWCHPDRLRNRAMYNAVHWNVAISPEQLEAALATIGPAPAGRRCNGEGR